MQKEPHLGHGFKAPRRSEASVGMALRKRPTAFWELNKASLSLHHWLHVMTLHGPCNSVVLYVPSGWLRLAIAQTPSRI